MRFRRFSELASMSSSDLNDLVSRLEDNLEALFNNGEEDSEDYKVISAYQVKVENILTMKTEDEAVLKSCRVFSDVKDWGNVCDERPDYFYTDNEIDMLSDYGFIIEIDSGSIVIEDAKRYARRK